MNITAVIKYMINSNNLISITSPNYNCQPVLTFALMKYINIVSLVIKKRRINKSLQLFLLTT